MLRTLPWHGKPCPASHKLQGWDDTTEHVLIIQHGDNLEARLVIPYAEASEYNMIPWLQRIHEYEGTAKHIEVEQDA